MTANKKTFTIASDGVDPNLVPKRRTWTDAEIPAIGLGTFGSGRFSNEVIADAVLGAIGVGYRHIDCASRYGNEHLIGECLKAAMKGGVERKELWITSKVWCDKHDDVMGSCKQSLKDLRLDYLDLFLIHWPFPSFHSQDCKADYRNPNAKPYSHEDYLKTWKQMEELVDMGLVKHIGTSNMTIPKLRLLLRDARIKPSCNEMELHPHFQQPELFQFVCENGIVPIGFCPIGSPMRPERDKTEYDTVDIEDPVVKGIALRLNVHPAVVCVKWAVQRGQIPIPFSVHRNEYLSNIKSTIENPLTKKEMTELSRIDKNCRLIKGHVFLWKEAQSWEDLWDPCGEITS